MFINDSTLDGNVFSIYGEQQRLENIYAELRNGITGREKILGAIQTELDDRVRQILLKEKCYYKREQLQRS